MQAVLVDQRLTYAFQWIVDGYNTIAAVIGAVFEPLLLPALTWLNMQLQWDLHLHPHWRPIFVLAMVLVISASRGFWKDRERSTAIMVISACGVAALIGAVIAGLFPLDGDWWAQALTAALPPTMVLMAFLAAGALLGARAGLTDWVLAAIVGAWSFAISVAIYVLSGEREGAGIIALALVIALLGFALLAHSIRIASTRGLGIALAIVGGFITAAVIVAADFALRALELA